MRILFVENHPVFAQNVITTFLQEHQVRVVPTIAEARQVAKSDSWDIILVDYDLDDGKGSELVAELKQEDSNQKIIGCSSHDAGNTALLKAGADAICGKMEFANIKTVIYSVFESEM